MDLSDNPITDRGARTLEAISSLKVLELGRTAITDQETAFSAPVVTSNSGT